MDNYDQGLVGLWLCVGASWLILAIIRRQDRNAPANIQRVHQRVVAAAAATAGVVTALIAIVVYVHAPPHETRSDLIGVAFVAVFSGLVGFTEIAQRYRDRPLRLLTVAPALIYVYINMAAGVGAFALVDEFGVFDAHMAHAALYRIMLASFGAVAFFRSSFFTARVGTTDVVWVPRPF